MKANNIGLLIVVSSFAVGCSTPEIKPPAPVARPIEMPTPRVKLRPKPKPKPIKTPYSAKVDRYSDNVAVRAQEVDGNTSIMSKQDSARKIDEESDRLDPYLSKSGKSGVTASTEESGTSTAVMALMLRAKVDMLAGRSDAAIDKLERGLRIQPSNPDLWNKLAEAHFHKGSYKQASSMAKKSISLTPRNNTDLLRRNWKLVANARKKMGDMQGMQDAMRASSSL